MQVHDSRFDPASLTALVSGVQRSCRTLLLFRCNLEEVPLHPLALLLHCRVRGWVYVRGCVGGGGGGGCRACSF